MSTSKLMTIAYEAGRANKVVFFHGLGGHPVDTWKQEGKDETFWPKWLFADLPDLNIYSFSYPAAPTDWQGHATSLVERADNALEHLLTVPDLADGQLVFICHSLGGLIVKQLVRRAAELAPGRQEADSLLKRLRGVVFIGTPHAGSSVASTLSLVSRIIRLSASSSDLIKNDPRLADLNSWYRNWSQTAVARHRVFYETKSLHGITAVDRASADPGLPFCQPIGLDGDHFQTCKPGDRSELVYVSTVAFLKHAFAGKPDVDFDQPVSNPPSPEAAQPPNNAGHSVSVSIGNISGSSISGGIGSVNQTTKFNLPTSRGKR